jgi:hypothetical protein
MAGGIHQDSGCERGGATSRRQVVAGVEQVVARGECVAESQSPCEGNGHHCRGKDEGPDLVARRAHGVGPDDQQHHAEMHQEGVGRFLPHQCHGGRRRQQRHVPPAGPAEQEARTEHERCSAPGIGPGVWRDRSSVLGHDRMCRDCQRRERPRAVASEHPREVPRRRGDHCQRQGVHRSECQQRKRPAVAAPPAKEPAGHEAKAGLAADAGREWLPIRRRNAIGGRWVGAGQCDHLRGVQVDHFVRRLVQRTQPGLREGVKEGEKQDAREPDVGWAYPH